MGESALQFCSTQALDPMENTSQPWQIIMDGLRNMPAAQAVLLVILFVFTLVGGNGVFALHYRRVGKPVLKSLFDPRSFPTTDFNLHEWLMLVGVVAVAALLIVCMALAG